MQNIQEKVQDVLLVNPLLACIEETTYFNDMCNHVIGTVHEKQANDTKETN